MLATIIMRSRFVTFASVSSLLLCLVTVAVWVQSYWIEDSISVENAQYPFIGNDEEGERMYADRISTVTITSDWGRLDIDCMRTNESGFLYADNVKDWRPFHPDGTHVRCDLGRYAPSNSPLPVFNVHDESVLFDHGGFFLGSYSIEGLARGIVDYTGHVVSVPLWLLTALTALLPMFKLRQWLRVRWRSEHVRCVTCGYDLAGNPSGVCPECGTAVQQKPETPTLTPHENQ